MILSCVFSFLRSASAAPLAAWPKRGRRLTSWPQRPAALAACLLLLASCDNTSSPDPIRIGANNWPGYEPLFIAETLEMYPAGQVHVVETPLNMGLVQAIRGTTIDAAATSLSRALHWANDGVDITILLALDYSNGADVLLAHPSIASVHDLAGKTIAGDMTSVNGYLLMRALEEAGLPPNAVTVVDLPNNQLASAYTAGQIQAATTFDASEEALLALGAHTIFDSSDIPGEISDVLIVRTNYLKQNPDKVDALITGWLHTMNTLNKWPADKPYPSGANASGTIKDKLARLHLIDEQENVALLANGGAKLQALMEKKLSVSARLGLLNTEAKLPRIDAGPFERARNRARQRGLH